MRTICRSIGLLIAFFLNGWSQPYTIGTVAGTDRLLDGSNANSVPLRDPFSIAADAGGNLFIADTPDNRIRRVSAAGVITTYAGTGVAGYKGDRGKATLAELN